MEFGLWVEPEMVNPDSDLHRAHPDWALQLAGRPLLTARNQLVLDMSRSDVADHILARLAALLDALPIAYLKWDHNRDLAPAASGGMAAYRAQVHAAWHLFDTVRARWPHVEIEACAGGGGRIDAGLLRRVHRVWTSDNLDAVSRVAIQRGFRQFFPPEIMGAHVGASPAHATGRSQSLDMRAGVAFGGHFGLELDPRHLRPDARDTLRAWIAAHKAVRHLLHATIVWQGEAGDGVSWVAQGSADEAIVTVLRTTPSTQRHPPRLRMPWVDAGSPYAVRTINPAQAPGDTADMAGGWLRDVGLALPAMKAEAALIFHLLRQ
jgi:alpha-galactosidase